MTKDELQAIRSHCEEIIDEYDTGFRSYEAIAKASVKYLAEQDIPALLAYVEGLEMESEYNRKLCEHIQKGKFDAEADRDRYMELADNYLEAKNAWKAKADALEMAFKDLAGCEYCIHYEVLPDESPCKECEDGDIWQFDQDRFEKNKDK